MITHSISQSEPALALFAQQARTALVADVLDALGQPPRHLPPSIKPLTTAGVLVGRALTLSCIAVDDIPEVPYRGLLKAIDMVAPGQVIVLPTGGVASAAVWGELVATVTRGNGALGMVTDGYVRDLEQLRQMEFPVFAQGRVPLDSNGRFEIVGVGQPVTIGGVIVRSGELVVADLDGVVVVPKEVEADLIRLLLEKANLEDDFRASVTSGISAADAFKMHGVL